MLKEIQNSFGEEKVFYTKQARDEDRVIIITVYQPDPDRWIDFERRKI